MNSGPMCSGRSDYASSVEFELSAVEPVLPEQLGRLDAEGASPSASLLRGGAFPIGRVQPMPASKSQPVGLKADWGAWEEKEAWRQRLKLFGVGDPVPLIYLGREMCRYPVAESAKAVGGHLFCGRPTAAEHPYCKEHRAKAITVPRGR